MTPCDYARDRHRDMARWRNLWTILQFVFGSAVTLLLSVAVLFFLKSAWLPAALSVLATVVGSVGIKWVTDRRAEAVKEEEAAYAEVKAACTEPQAQQALKGIHADFRLVGKWR
jgi:hypothetical protein